MSTKPRKIAAAKVAAKEAVRFTGEKPGTDAGSVGPRLARDKSELGKKKPSRSVSERSDNCAGVQVAILAVGPGGTKIKTLNVA